ncbi:copper resistance CopC/CopD family protein [Streptomyces gramineus]|uniref:copper resistance CopC/CopD family protein n=1 Tax=Streptomyces gramineus TaxID=910542 RepID=UPI00398ABE90
MSAAGPASVSSGNACFRTQDGDVSQEHGRRCTTAPRGTLRALALLGSLLTALLLASAAPASAHAALRGSDPADGAVLKSSPGSVTLTFTESVGLLDDSFRVYDPTNHRVTTGGPGHGPGGADTARITFPKRLGTGTFTVAWRVVSADSHPVSGALTFSVGEPSATTAAVPAGPVEDPATGSLYDIGRYVAYLAVALLLGGIAFLALCRPPDPGPLRGPIRTAWWTLLAATLFLFLLRSPYEEGTSPAAAFDLSALGGTATGRPGLVLLARVALLAVTAGLYAVLVRRRTDRFRPSSRPFLITTGILAVALALTWATAEHASAGIQVPLAITSSVLHLLAMSLWLGGLTALLTLLRRTDAGSLPAAVVTRFSRVAFASVTVLVVTGVYQSWRGLGSWQALTGTAYGRLLLVKIAAVVLLLAAASQSRRWTARLAGAPVTAAVTARDRVPQTVGAPPEATPPAAPEPDPAPDHRGLRRSVLAEVAVGVAVLVVTTILTGTLPGRAAAEAADQGTGGVTAGGIPAAAVAMVPFDVGTPNGHGKVQITLDPGRVGANSVQAVVFGPDDGISAVPELRLSFTLAAQKIGPLPAALTDRGGYWATDAVNLPIPGEWTMNLTVRVSDLDQVTVTKRIRIAG